MKKIKEFILAHDEDTYGVITISFMLAMLVSIYFGNFVAMGVSAAIYLSAVVMFVRLLNANKHLSDNLRREATARLKQKQKIQQIYEDDIRLLNLRHEEILRGEY